MADAGFIGISYTGKAYSSKNDVYGIREPQVKYPSLLEQPDPLMQPSSDKTSACSSCSAGRPLGDRYYLGIVDGGETFKFEVRKGVKAYLVPSSSGELVPAVLAGDKFIAKTEGILPANKSATDHKIGYKKFSEGTKVNVGLYDISLDINSPGMMQQGTLGKKGEFMPSDSFTLNGRDFVVSASGAKDGVNSQWSNLKPENIQAYQLLKIKDADGQERVAGKPLKFSVEERFLTGILPDLNKIENFLKTSGGQEWLKKPGNEGLLAIDVYNKYVALFGGSAHSYVDGYQGKLLGLMGKQMVLTDENYDDWVANTQDPPGGGERKMGTHSSATVIETKLEENHYKGIGEYFINNEQLESQVNGVGARIYGGKNKEVFWHNGEKVRFDGVQGIIKAVGQEIVSGFKESGLTAGKGFVVGAGKTPIISLGGAVNLVKDGDIYLSYQVKDIKRSENKERTGEAKGKGRGWTSRIIDGLKTYDVQETFEKINPDNEKALDARTAILPLSVEGEIGGAEFNLHNVIVKPVEESDSKTGKLIKPMLALQLKGDIEFEMSNWKTMEMPQSSKGDTKPGVERIIHTSWMTNSFDTPHGIRVSTEGLENGLMEFEIKGGGESLGFNALWQESGARHFIPEKQVLSMWGMKHHADWWSTGTGLIGFDRDENGNLGLYGGREGTEFATVTLVPGGTLLHYGMDAKLNQAQSYNILFNPLIKNLAALVKKDVPASVLKDSQLDKDSISKIMEEEYSQELPQLAMAKLSFSPEVMDGGVEALWKGVNSVDSRLGEALAISPDDWKPSKGIDAEVIVGINDKKKIMEGVVTKGPDGSVSLSAKNGEALDWFSIPLALGENGNKKNYPGEDKKPTPGNKLLVSSSDLGFMTASFWGNIPLDVDKVMKLTAGGLEAGASPDVFAATEYEFMGHTSSLKGVPFYYYGQLRLMSGHMKYDDNGRLQGAAGSKMWDIKGQPLLLNTSNVDGAVKDVVDNIYTLAFATGEYPDVSPVAEASLYGPWDKNRMMAKPAGYPLLQLVEAGEMEATGLNYVRSLLGLPIAGFHDFVPSNKDFDKNYYFPTGKALVSSNEGAEWKTVSVNNWSKKYDDTRNSFVLNVPLKEFNIVLNEPGRGGSGQGQPEKREDNPVEPNSQVTTINSQPYVVINKERVDNDNDLLNRDGKIDIDYSVVNANSTLPFAMDMQGNMRSLLGEKGYTNLYLGRVLSDENKAFYYSNDRWLADGK